MACLFMCDGLSRMLLKWSTHLLQICDIISVRVDALKMVEV